MVFGVSRPKRVNARFMPSAIAYAANSGEGVHPAMLICPGGGYFLLAWRHEGMEIAEWANSLGMDAFILKYRVPNDGSIALMDAQRAVSWMRANAATLQIDPAKIAQIGFSAGANLTARTANMFLVCTGFDF